MQLESEKPMMSEITDSGTEAIVLRIWKQILGNAAADAQGNDSFFALGGSSICTVLMLDSVKTEFGYAPSLPEFYNCPTAAALAQLLDSGKPIVAKTYPIDDVVPYRLPTPAQLRCYLADQMAPGSALNNVCTTIQLTGTLNADALQQAYRAIVERHETLRYVFVPADGHGSVRIKIMEGVQPIAEVLAESEAAILQEAERLARAPFQLEAGPLIRATLITESASSHVLSLTFSAAVCDERSADLLVRELLTAYYAIEEGGAPAFEEMPITFSQYASKLKDPACEELQESQLLYWSEQLKGASASVIAGDWPRPTERALCGARYTSVL